MGYIGIVLLIIIGIFVIYSMFNSSNKKMKSKMEKKEKKEKEEKEEKEIKAEQINTMTTMSVDIKGILKKYAMEKIEDYELHKEEIDKILDNIDDEQSDVHISKNMMPTPSIRELHSIFSSVSRPDNAMIRSGYETRMYSQDYSSFIKIRICNNDIESIWQFLCICKEYEYDELPHTRYGFLESLILKRMIKLAQLDSEKKHSYEIINIYENREPIAKYEKIKNALENKFSKLERQIFHDVIQKAPITNKILLKQTFDLNFKEIISVTESCWQELLAAYILYIPIDYVSLERGRTFLTTDIPDTLAYALSIYDFSVINLLPLIERANYLIKIEAEEFEYFKDIPFFDISDFSKKYSSPVIDEKLKAKLSGMGINERHYFLHDCFPSGGMTAYYRTKTYGIDENIVNKELIDDELLVPYCDYDCLLEQSKETLISVAAQCNIIVRKSWKKDKIYDTIVQEGSRLELLHEIILGFGRYKINPLYKENIEELIEYHNTIKPLMVLLGFI